MTRARKLLTAATLTASAYALGAWWVPSPSSVASHETTTTNAAGCTAAMVASMPDLCGNEP